MWTLVRFPIKADGKPGDPTNREVGEILSPRFTRESIERIEAENPLLFAGHYQGTPLAEVGGLFKRTDFHIVGWEETLRVPRWVVGWDLAAKVKEHNDYTAGAYCGVDEHLNLYIRDVYRFKLRFPEARAEIIAVAKHVGSDAPIAIEDISHGTSMFQDLVARQDLSGFSVLPVKAPTVQKRQRASAWASRAAAGKLFLVQGAWNEPFINECLAFDGFGVTHDDQVDAVSIAWEALHMDSGQTYKDKNPVAGSLDYYRQLGKQGNESWQ